MSWKLLILTALTGAVAVTPMRGDDLVPLPLVLPGPALKGTPQNLPTGTTAEPLTSKPPPVFYAPKGVVNVALHKPVTASDTNLITGELSQITDGRKSANENNVVTLRRGFQWVQIDLQGEYDLYAIVVWHDFTVPVVFRDVIVQVSDDPAFTTRVHTLFNNDQQNQEKLGLGTDREYFDNPLTGAGKLIDAHGTRARYIRCYSHGSTDNAWNTYIEVEAYGRPAS